MNPPSPDVLAVEPVDDHDELARAELYGLLSRLWLAPPDAGLMAQFRVAVTQAPQPGGALEAPWQSLVGALRATDEQAAAEEYDALFGGLGKPEIFLYGSYYLSGHLHDQPLATLRADLQRLGLTRDESRAETEDHLAYELEVMRYLIAGGDAGVSNLEQQRRFFRAHVQPWVDLMCDAVASHPRASTWRELAVFTKAFVAVEAQGFDMLES